MAKIVFVEDEKSQEVKASSGEAQELFRLADMLSEAELERMKRAVNLVEQKSNQLAQGK